MKGRESSAEWEEEVLELNPISTEKGLSVGVPTGDAVCKGPVSDIKKKTSSF